MPPCGALRLPAPPTKNINTVAPFLTLAYLHERQPNPAWLPVINEWAEWVMDGLPRTEEDGFQHIVFNSENPQQLWDDTLMMTVLPLAKIGLVLNRPHYIEAAKKQFLLHIKVAPGGTEALAVLAERTESFEVCLSAFTGLQGRANCPIRLPPVSTGAASRGDAGSSAIWCGESGTERRQTRPSGRQSNSALPPSCDSMLAITLLVPNPLDAGISTAGPPVSTHMMSRRPDLSSQLTDKRPASVDSAPSFASDGDWPSRIAVTAAESSPALRASAL